MVLRGRASERDETDRDTWRDWRETDKEKKNEGDKHTQKKKRDTEKKAEAQTNIETRRFGNRHMYIKVIAMGIQRCTERNTFGERERVNIHRPRKYKLHREKGDTQRQW